MSENSNSSSAYDRGYAMGVGRASWVFDGNTDAATYRAFLAGFEDGDPMILDTYAHQFNLGEWAGESVVELGLVDDVDSPDVDDYLFGFEDGYWAELVRVATYHVGGDES